MNDEKVRPSIRLDDTLWKAIADHDFNDGPAELTFEQRLARENHWTADYTARVMGEYRRFLYLTARSGHAVTPSDPVDQAWHLHLVYTRNYWDVLCAKVLGFPLHHGPTRGGEQEADKYTDWYQRTLNAYAEHFATAPPADVWPATEDRFKGEPVRVDPATHWIIHKSHLIARLCATGIVMAAAVAGMALLPRVALAGAGGKGQMSTLGVAFLIALGFNVLLLVMGLRRAAIWVSLAFAPVYFAVFFGAELLAKPKLIFVGMAIWALLSLFVFSMFYKKKGNSGSTSTGCSSAGCSSGCWTYTGGSSEGGGGDSSGCSGGDGGGSGCGGGCGGGGGD